MKKGLVFSFTDTGSRVPGLCPRRALRRFTQIAMQLPGVIAQAPVQAPVVATAQIQGSQSHEGANN
jgi:hypothetical protein